MHRVKRKGLDAYICQELFTTSLKMAGDWHGPVCQ